ncbi:hypothetical protein N9C35_05080, partial [Flavobacteriaceae bacterium]|nr:hypothetical protein [Flavobacteriaceae bacterium]
QGQSAKILIIGCSDSLVDPIALTGASPGELFIHRNISGLVPAFNDKQDNIHSTSAVLDYAVNALDVDDIIVLGHGCCGGVLSLIKNNPNSQLKGYAESWLRIVKPAVDKIINKSKDLSLKEQRALCEQEATKISLENLKTFPFIREKLKDKKINLHAWHFDRGRLSIFRNNIWNLVRDD